MSQEQRGSGHPYDKIPPGPKSDLGDYFYKTLLRNVTSGLLMTSEAIGEFAATRGPKLAKSLRANIGRLSKISAAAARGQLDQVNVEYHMFQDADSAEDFASFVSKKDAELFAVPSSITHLLHDPSVHVSDGIARESLVPSLKTLVTEVMPRGSNRRLYSVRLVGVARLNQPVP